MATKEKNEIVKDQVNVPANIDLEAQAGAGMETVGVKDMAIPFLKILQALSPECKKSKPEYIEGAEEGKICNTVTGELYDSVQIVPCFYQFVINEWKPDRGGYVGTHLESSPALAKARRNAKGSLVSEDGNDLVDTANWYVLIRTHDGNWTWGVLAFTSTQLKKSRNLMSRLQSIKMNGKNGLFTPPIYAHILDLSTVPESNDQGDWSGWKIELAGKKAFEDQSLFNLAIQYHEQVKKGLVKAVPVAENVEPDVY